MADDPWGAFNPEAKASDPWASFSPQGGHAAAAPEEELKPSPAITDIPKEIAAEAKAGASDVAGVMNRGKMGAVEALTSIPKAILGAGRVLASPITGAISSIGGHTLANVEHGFGEHVVNPLMEHFGYKAQHPDEAEMYETAKGDVNKAMMGARPYGATLKPPGLMSYEPKLLEPPGVPPREPTPPPAPEPPMQEPPRQTLRPRSGVDLLNPDVPHTPRSDVRIRSLSAAGPGGPLSDISPETQAYLRQIMQEQGLNQNTLDDALEAMSAHHFFGEITPSLEADMGAVAAPPGLGKQEVMGSLRQRGAEKLERMQSTFNRAFGQNEDVAQLHRLIDIDKQKAASPIYQQFRQTPIPPSPEVEAIIPRLRASGALQAANKALAEEGLPASQGFVEGPAANAFDEGTQVTRVPTAAAFDYAKQHLDGLINTAMKNEDANAARRYTQMKHDLDAALDAHPTAGRLWQQAREAYGGPTARQEAMKFGQRVLTANVGADELPFLTAGYNPAQMQGLRVGIRKYLEDKLGSRREVSADIFTSTLSPNNVQKIRWAIGDQAADELVTAMEHEYHMHGAPTRIVGGSPTAFREAAKKRWTVQPAPEGLISDLGVKDVLHPAKTVTRKTIEAVTKRSEAKNLAAAEAKMAKLREEASRVFTLQGPERDAAARHLLGGEGGTPRARGGRVSVQKTAKARASGGAVGRAIRASKGYAEGGDVSKPNYRNLHLRQSDDVEDRRHERFVPTPGVFGNGMDTGNVFDTGTLEKLNADTDFVPQTGPINPLSLHAGIGDIASKGYAEGGAPGDDYNTAVDEPAFQAWKSVNAPRDSGYDYDMRGAYKAGFSADPKTHHWPDTYKKPNHDTFSDESMYATGANRDRAGFWTGPGHDVYVPPAPMADGGAPEDPKMAGIGIRPVDPDVDWSQMNKPFGRLVKPDEDVPFSTRFGDTVQEGLSSAGMNPYTARDLREGVGGLLDWTGIPNAADTIDAERRGDKMGVIKGMAGMIPGVGKAGKALEESTGVLAGAIGRTAEEPPLSSIIKRGEPIMPRRPAPSDEELAAARADTRVGNAVVGDRLDTIVPEHERVAGGSYTPGAPNGGRWSDLPEEILSQPGAGFRVTDDQLKQAWDQSVAESSQAAKKAVEESGAQPKFASSDWDQAMKLPYRDQLWYELSGERMAENLPELSPTNYMKLMDLIGATSARAEPGENLERALAVLSQQMRKKPVDVDLTIPSTVRQALSRNSNETSALPGNKTGHFSDTLALTGGVPTRFPISVNDVWVGKMFGVSDKEMTANQSLHEPMAKYFNKIRDLYNETHGAETPFTYQSWNFQAPAWVHLRNQEAGATSGDAYHQVWGTLIDKLKAAGVKGIEGDKITNQALMDPKFADALRRTTPAWRDAPKATVEFGTTQSNVGKSAHDLYQKAIESGDTKSQQEYLQGLTSAMHHSARGEHPWDALKKAVTGDVTKGNDITRIAHPGSEAPLDVGGTFEGAVSPNIRVPLKGMSEDQINYFNAVAGKHLKQDAMAASEVRAAEQGSEPAEGYIRGHSAFVPTTDQIQPEHIRDFAKELATAGHDMSYVRYPNGYQFDVLPNFAGDMPKGVTPEALGEAYAKTMEPHYGEPIVSAHDFKSVYTPSTDYGPLRSKLIKEMSNDFVKQATAAGTTKDAVRKVLQDPSLSGSLTGRAKKAWDTYRARLDHLANAEKGFKGLAEHVSNAHSNFTTKAQARAEKALKKAPKTPEAFRLGGAVMRAIVASRDGL